MNNAFEKMDTFGGWLCDFLFRRLNATVQVDAITKMKCYVVKKLVIFVGGAFSLDTSI